MIISAFAEYLKTFNSDIPSVVILSRWLKSKLMKEPENNVERVIHSEICLAQSKLGVFMLVGKTPTGKILLESLYNFALSYEQHKFSKWVHDLKPGDFQRIDKS